MNRIKYSLEFEKFISNNTSKLTFEELYQKVRKKFKYNLSRDNFRKMLSRRKLRYKDYNPKYNTQKGGFTPGVERNNRLDGMVMVKKEDGTWDYKQRVIWEKQNGPIPKNHFIIFLDGNRNNYSINNLACVTARESSIYANLKLPTVNKEITKASIILAKSIIKMEEEEEKCKKNKKKKH